MGTKRSEKGGIRGVGRTMEARHRIGKIWIKILKEMRGGDVTREGLKPVFVIEFESLNSLRLMWEKYRR